MTTPDNPLIDAARGRDAEQPEALRLAGALDCEGHAGMSKAAKELRRQHARITELESELFAERRHSRSRNAAAVRTLAAMGYSWHGIEQWTPPRTAAP